MKSISHVSRIPLLIVIFVVLFTTLTCTCNLTGITTPVPTVSSGLALTPEEQSNSGTHTYHQVAEEFNCSTDAIEKDMHISVTFSSGAVEIIPVETPSGGHVYYWVARNTYSRTDDSSSPVYVITITFNQQGFVLYSEYTEDGQNYLPCLRYTRTLLD